MQKKHIKHKTKHQRGVDFLVEEELIHSRDVLAVSEVIESFSFQISSQMLKQIDKNNPHDPIAKQFIPSTQELTISPLERTDPIGDSAFSPVRGIIHRYPDRCLLLPLHVCPVYCRFCFRKEKVGSSSETLTPDEMDAALAYINEHKEIWEVILSGGDPLILKPSMLKTIIQRLSAIEHVEVIRLHTRVPVVEPQKINAELITALRCHQAVYVVLHANHPNEFSQEAITACAVLVDAGIPLLSQTILLKDINDNIETLSQLMRCFIKNRIKPYYLHHGDFARGTEHFRTSIETGQVLMKELRGRFSGMCQPTYVLDIPGGHGKMPIGPNYLVKESDASYRVEDYRGCVHVYPPK